MENPKNISPNADKDELSIQELLARFKFGVAAVKENMLLLIVALVIGGALGLAYAFVKKPVYSAVCTFVLEESSKGGGLGQYAGLASLAGIDIGGSGGLFQGDNIIELYRSRQMIQKTLLHRDTFNNKPQLLIDRYVEFHKLREEWKENKSIGQVSFEGNPAKFNRTQDSLITDIVNLFNKKFLNVSKPDKKLSIIKVQFDSKDELFAKQFVNVLVDNVNDFYVQTKTKKSLQNVSILQFQADSVRRVLNSSLSGVASAIDATPNANPLLVSLRVPSQRRQVDVQASSAVYGEIVKNLELAKVSLRQEKPLIQIIDQPILPLFVTKIGKVKGIALGAVLLVILAAGVFFVRGAISTRI